MSRDARALRILSEYIEPQARLEAASAAMAALQPRRYSTIRPQSS